MGVFDSPVEDGKKRRVDIKFYPFREKAFATLYFTGNGYFNRSMRLYAKKRKGMALDDHGLYRRDESYKNSKGDRFETKSEKEVFDLLGLVYREPQQRDSFDAVREKGSNKPVLMENPGQRDFIQESQHRWIE